MPEQHIQSGWTLDTLRERLLAEINALDQRVNLQFVKLDKRITDHFDQTELRYVERMQSSERALAKVDAANEKRFENVNEFRGQMSDMMRTFIPRLEAEARMANFGERLEVAEKSIIENRSRGSGIQAGWALAVGALIGIGGIVIAIIKH
jgi:hypothetical protein